MIIFIISEIALLPREALYSTIQELFDIYDIIILTEATVVYIVWWAFASSCTDAVKTALKKT